MKKLAIVLCVAAMAATAALPALAQPGNWNLRARVDATQAAIDRAVADGALNRPEHDRVQNELNRIRQRANEFRQIHGELTPMVRQQSEQELDTVVAQIHWIRASEWRRPW